MQPEKARPSLLPLVLTLATLIVAFHLGSALLGRPLFLALPIGPALEYARGSIDLLRPLVVGFNATGTPTAQEFPLWQAAAALAFKATGSNWLGWANLVSLLLFATALWPFFQLARQYLGDHVAWWGTVFLLAEPLIILQAGNASTNGLSLAVTLWFIFYADKMIRTGALRWWLPTALLAALGAVSKLPFFMAVGLCGASLLFINGCRAWRTWLLLASAGALAAAVFGLWTHHADALAAQAEYPYMELRLSHCPWLKGGWRFLHATLGSLALVVLLVPALFRPGNRLPKLWLLATFLTTLVFTHLVLEHWHYYLMCCPPVALLCGSTLARCEDFWEQELPSLSMRFCLAAVVLPRSIRPT